MISKYENIWQLLSTHDLKKEIPKKFHCTICGNVVIEPYVAPCECRFCFKCIKEYLKDEVKYCPGGKNECMEECLEVDVNVLRDIVSIRSLARLKIKCPNDMCEARRTLDIMVDHIRICGMNSVKCPYEMMGCDGGQISKDNVKIHYDNEWFTHSQLLVEAIDNLRNDVNRFSNVVERRDEEINMLQEAFTKKEDTIIEMKLLIDDQRKEIEILKDKDGRRENEIELLRKELSIMKETQKILISEEIENLKKDIVEVDMREDIKDQKNFFNEISVNQENIKREMSSVIMKVRDSRIYDEREFIWRVDNFSKLRDGGPWRDIIISRYSVKFNISLRCRGDYLGHGCVILMGKFDDYLQWPLPYKIAFSLINQDTMKVHKSQEYKYNTYKKKSAFLQPSEKLNYFIGDNKFITIKDLMDSPGLLVKDSFVVSFKVKP